MNQKFLSQKLINEYPQEVESGLFYSINESWLNKQEGDKIERLKAFADKYGLQLVQISNKDERKPRITESEVNELIRFDVSDFGYEYSLFEPEAAALQCYKEQMTCFVADNEPSAKKAFANGCLDNYRLAMNRFFDKKDNEVVVMFCDVFYNVVKTESTKLSFDGYNWEIGFYCPNEDEL